MSEFFHNFHRGQEVEFLSLEEAKLACSLSEDGQYMHFPHGRIISIEEYAQVAGETGIIIYAEDEDFSAQISIPGSPADTLIFSMRCIRPVS